MIGLKGRSKMPRIVLFIAIFPALWLFAAWLDRIWLSTSELDVKRRREKPNEKIAVPEE